MDRVVHIHVPSYENLALKLIYAFFEQHRNVLKFLPEGTGMVTRCPIAVQMVRDVAAAEHSCSVLADGRV